MVILFILVGSLIGAGAAAVTLLSGGSILFALLSYSVFGSLGGLLISIVLYMRDEAKEQSADWAEVQKANQPVSA